MWMEEQNKNRVNVKRTLQLLDTGAKTIASACPFCMTMLTDGLKAQDKEKDIEPARRRRAARPRDRLRARRAKRSDRALGFGRAHGPPEHPVPIGVDGLRSRSERFGLRHVLREGRRILPRREAYIVCGRRAQRPLKRGGQRRVASCAIADGCVERGADERVRLPDPTGMLRVPAVEVKRELTVHFVDPEREARVCESPSEGGSGRSTALGRGSTAVSGSCRR